MILLQVLIGHSEEKRCKKMKNATGCFGSDVLARSIRSHKTQLEYTPTMYGLPKIHKPDMPLRPILSSVGSFSYDCAKWLSDSLSELRHHETCVKDTLLFLSLLQDRSSSGKITTTFDVTSLFTNVPVNFTINLILDSVFRRSDEFNGLNRRRMKKLLEWVVKTTTFQFNGRFYRQVDGVAIGSPTAP